MQHYLTQSRSIHIIFLAATLSFVALSCGSSDTANQAPVGAGGAYCVPDPNLEPQDCTIQSEDLNDNEITEPSELEPICNSPCTRIEFANISGHTGIENLKALNRIEVVEGDLKISHHKNLKTLEGLESLKRVEKELVINRNEGLENLNGLENLKTINGPLRIASNKGLKTLDGLDSLETVTDDSWSGPRDLGIQIDYNHQLESLDSFESLRRTGGRLNVSDNNSLKQLNAFQNLQYAGDTLGVARCNSITDISSLVNIERVDGSVVFTKNDSLPQCHAEHVANQIEQVKEDLLIQENNNEKSCE